MGKLNIYITFLFSAYLMGCTLATYNLDKASINLVRDQIEMEMRASLFYQTYGHFFEHSKQALHGFAKYFFDQSLEEKKHADKLMTYLNKRDIRVRTMPAVKEFCSLITDKVLCTYITDKKDIKNTTVQEDTLKAIQDALQLEEKVFDELEKIAKCQDPQLAHFIEHEYLDEQIESIKELTDYKSQLQNIGNQYVGLLLMDRWLLEKKRTEL